MPQGPSDIVRGILDCYEAEEHCLVSAILIDDKNKRIDAALKCLADRTDCLNRVGRAAATQKEIERLKKHLGR